jgi:hypothetical protein
VDALPYCTHAQDVCNSDKECKEKVSGGVCLKVLYNETLFLSVDCSGLQNSSLYKSDFSISKIGVWTTISDINAEKKYRYYTQD